MSEMNAPTWQPSLEHALLVRAATAAGDQAHAAWEAWLQRVDTDKLDGISLRMVPMLHRNLLTQGVNDARLRALAPLYKHIWATNQVAMRHLEELLAAFAAAGIDTLVLKGAALLLRYYEDKGTRPMADIDVLVPVEQTDAAFAVLVERGWQGHKPLHLISEDRRAPFHGMGYQHPDKPLGCDLHWHVMHMNLAAHYDAPLWAAAEPLQVGSVRSRVLCAEHQLMHILFNGCMNEDGANLRWLLDALVVLRREPNLQWDRLVEECQFLEFVQPAAAMLDYLRREWQAPIPGAVVETLRQTPVRFAIRKAYAGLNTRKAERSGMQVFWILYTQYQLSQEGSRRFFPRDFIRFLRARWALEGGVGQTIHYAWQRVRGMEAQKAKQVVSLE